MLKFNSNLFIIIFKTQFLYEIKYCKITTILVLQIKLNIQGVSKEVIVLWSALGAKYLTYRNNSFTVGKTGLLAFECQHYF